MIHCESEIERDKMLNSITECINFANTQAPARPVIQTAPQSLASSPIDRIASRTPASATQRSPAPYATAPSSSSHGDHNGVASDALAMQMGKVTLEPGQTMAWPSAHVPPATQPQTQPRTQAARPVRGASLTKSQPAPQQRQQQQQHGARHVSPGMVMPGSLDGGFSGVRNLSMRSNESDRSGFSGGHHGQQPPTAFQQNGYAPQPFGQAQMPAPPRVFQPEMRRHDELPPVPQIRGGDNDNFSDSGAPSPGGLSAATMPIRAKSADPYHRTDTFHSTVSSQSAFSTQSMPTQPQPIQAPSERFVALKSNSAPPTTVDDEDDEEQTSEQPVALTGPAVITAQMKCKVFLQQGHGQWKSLGHGKLKLYVEKGRNVKQLVVESDKRKSAVLISTIVLTDGIERVARTGVAVEVSDQGQRTGIIYMIQLRNEASAGGLYDSLVAGSNRSRR